MDPRFLASYYFDLHQFPYKELFPEGEPVWKTLELIKPFLERFKLGKIESPVPEGAFLVNPEQISIGPGCLIEPGAYIAGPALIGAGVHIRQGAYLRGFVIACEKSVIGHATEVKNALLFPGAQAAHFNYVGDSILGARVNLGAGTKCANLKMDHNEVSVSIEDKRVATGLRKFGLIAGDGVELGCNSVTNPGSCFGKGAFLYPCTASSGFVPSGAHVRLPFRPEVVNGSL